ncbi:hypothetical protein MGYG_08508 [Nannizzia gypsea CBS 118893]|uniref:Uncharacterized protein n=1 Tax=Arthroderma gypseum (strain ATCC MYA-4604 / CBS 118893) TaxID=535722 RepID=E4V5W8_ARTGP|nr:hypothetical protein MGYG_08508 [Nannizzia gypsea CBS 118893]EFR05493.1 hypothetical protein MGYG_08508 [Nannizzia gypsea CBS 118893]
MLARFMIAEDETFKLAFVNGGGARAWWGELLFSQDIFHDNRTSPGAQLPSEGGCQLEALRRDTPLPSSPIRQKLGYRVARRGRGVLRTCPLVQKALSTSTVVRDDEMEVGRERSVPEVVRLARCF